MGLFDSWNEKKKRNTKIAKTAKKLRQIEKDIERSKQRVKEITSEQEKLLIQTYGSKDKIPQVMKKKFGIK